MLNFEIKIFLFINCRYLLEKNYIWQFSKVSKVFLLDEVTNLNQYKIKLTWEKCV